jgi:hypothetical protein
MVTFEDTQKNPNLCRFYQSMGFKNRRDDRGGYFSLVPLPENYAPTVMSAPPGAMVRNTPEGLVVQTREEVERTSVGQEEQEKQEKQEEQAEQEQGQQEEQEEQGQQEEQEEAMTDKCVEAVAAPPVPPAAKGAVASAEDATALAAALAATEVGDVEGDVGDGADERLGESHDQ